MLFSQEPLRLQSHCTSPVPNCKFDLSSLNTFYVDFCHAHPQSVVSLGPPLSVLAPVAAASTHLSATVVRSFFLLLFLSHLVISGCPSHSCSWAGLEGHQGLEPQRDRGWGSAARSGCQEEGEAALMILVFSHALFFFPNSCVVVVLFSAYGSLSVSLDHVILN